MDIIACEQRACPGVGLRRTTSAGDVRRHRFRMMTRSPSEPLLRCSSKPSAAPEPSRLKGAPAGPVSGLHFPFDTGGASNGGHPVDLGYEGTVPPAHEELDDGKRANWVERVLQLRRLWKGHRETQAGCGGGLPGNDQEKKDGECCAAPYDSTKEEGGEVAAEFDREGFSRLLAGVPWEEIKMFSQLAFLCNVAYVIPQLKAEDLRSYYDLRWVTSSLEKKAEAAAAAAAGGLQNRRDIPAAAYGIAASYVHPHTAGHASAGGVPDVEVGDPGCARWSKGDGNAQKSEMAVAEAEAAARGLRSLQSSPCEWFVCDDPNTCTRFFVIQGSDSLASWQTNLFFEPTKFEGTGAVVHRGMYEAAKGIYELFVPEVLRHLARHGGRARVRFTGHSLGGSLSLLVHLMLLARQAAAPSALLPVVTFGSPFVFCGGGRVLDELGVLDEGQVCCCVVMHRDIVPRAFSCSYPDRVAQVLRRLRRPFRSHPCLNRDKLLYSPLGKLYILQPNESYSPAHPLLPPGCAIYSLDGGGAGKAEMRRAVRAFLNTPHPLETLGHPAAYGSEGTILRDHESCSYLKAVNEVLRRHTRWVVRRSREQRLQHWWPLLTVTLRDRTPWSRQDGLVEAQVATEDVVTGRV
ncbi:hypothetical protein Taro_044189 [Colocasia esculenta]|uniref:Fungal lipase-type domain-containing protein n=1 Tax=Colocasia esculenta TaxID=4460 RepID=A0A843X0B1_COLES|nr:hypothetical protein [Colocasia esculenta]